MVDRQGPIFIILSEPPAPPRLTFLARIEAAAAAAPRHYAHAPPRLGPNSAALPASRDTTTIFLTGDTPRQPGNFANSVSDQLRVVADDNSTWQAIASALTRSCDGATLVPKSAPRRSVPSVRPPAR